MSDTSRTVSVLHFADPWCFWSWGMEPLLQRLRVVYGDNLAVGLLMGGMANSFDKWQKTYRVDDRGTSEWIQDAAHKTGHPNDPGYMVNLRSAKDGSYGSCRAAKAGQRQGAHKGEHYVRRLMEVFQLEGLPPTRETFLSAGKDVALDLDQLSADLDSTECDEAFREDRHLMHKYGVGFVHLVVVVGERVRKVAGAFQARGVEAIIDDLAPGLPKHQPDNILAYANTMVGHLLHAREIAEVFQIPDRDAETRLAALYDADLIGKRALGFADYWVPRESTSPEADVPDAARVSA